MESTNQSNNNTNEVTVNHSKKGKNFKKRIVSLCSLSVVILLVLGFSGCSNNKTISNKVENETTKPENETTKPENETAKPDDETAKPDDETTKANDDYELLKEFIEFISEYGDLPEDVSSEEHVYCKEQYDSWRAGEAFSNIVIDETGHIAFADHVEKFMGNWDDTWSQRCSMEIDGGPHEYRIYIQWSSSATEVTRWRFTGDYDSKTGRIIYTGDCIEERYTEDGEEEQEIIYENGTGSFYMIDGLLYWDDDIDEQNTNCVFERNNYRD